MLADAACVPVRRLAAMASSDAFRSQQKRCKVPASDACSRARTCMHARDCGARAGVPGMVGGMLRHMRSLRTMRRECADPPDSFLSVRACLMLCTCMHGARSPRERPAASSVARLSHVRWQMSQARFAGWVLPCGCIPLCASLRRRAWACAQPWLDPHAAGGGRERAHAPADLPDAQGEEPFAVPHACHRRAGAPTSPLFRWGEALRR